MKLQQAQKTLSDPEDTEVDSRTRGGQEEGLGRKAPVSEREKQCQEAPASICKPLVAPGQEEDFVLSKGSTEQRQHIGDA